jgi:hypothetical protein
MCERFCTSSAVSRVLLRFVARVIISNPLQVKAIAHAHVKTDKIDAGTLASFRAAGYLPEIGRRTPSPSANVGWRPDATKSCAAARGSRTRFTRSCTRT